MNDSTTSRSSAPWLPPSLSAALVDLARHGIFCDAEEGRGFVSQGVAKPKVAQTDRVVAERQVLL